jgi:hypothetical protein
VLENCASAYFLDTWLEQKSDPNMQAMSDNLQALPATWATLVDDLSAVAFDERWHFAGWSSRTQANGQVTWGNLHWK